MWPRVREGHSPKNYRISKRPPFNIEKTTLFVMYYETLFNG